MLDSIIIGAGVTGACIASSLSDQGALVHVVEKSRGPGGRCSARRAVVNSETIQWYHGAITLSTDHDVVRSHKYPHDAIRQLLHGVPVSWTWHVEAIDVHEHGVSVTSSTGDIMDARSCIITVPAPQVLQWSGVVGRMSAEQVARVTSLTYDPAYAVMLLVDRVPTESIDGVEGIRIHERTPSGLLPVTIITTAQWARDHLATSIDELRSYWRSCVEAHGVKVIHCDVHRWRYAVPTARSAEPLIKVAERIVVTGDAWTGKPWQELSLRSLLK